VTELIALWAASLKSIDSDFAIDSSGFGNGWFKSLSIEDKESTLRTEMGVGSKELRF
jgi:hypothetical protein